MFISIIGVGYVGLVTAACFSEMGHHVTCLDIDQAKILQLNRGEIPIYEPGLEEMVHRNQKAGRLTFTVNYNDALKNSEVCFIAVSTPSADDGSANLSAVYDVAQKVGKLMHKPLIVVVKSTVPVGTAYRVKRIIAEQNPPHPFHVVSNPEFLKEGCAINDCLHPDRIIIGSDNEEASELMKELYHAFTWKTDRTIVMDIPSAEMTKYAANSMLAARISFMNELSRICEKTGANINEVRRGIGSDKRIGPDFLYAGIGWGGSCFPKDIQALEQLAASLDLETPILSAVRRVNEEQKATLVQKVTKHFEKSGGLEGKTIALWGLAFKPETDDIREAPSLVIIKALLDAGAMVRAYDPIAMPNVQRILPEHPRLHFCSDEYKTAKDADAIILATEWKQFRFADLDRLLAQMKGNAFFDGRNQYNVKTMVKKGFDYYGVGIPKDKTQLLEQLHELYTAKASH